MLDANTFSADEVSDYFDDAYDSDGGTTYDVERASRLDFYRPRAAGHGWLVLDDVALLKSPPVVWLATDRLPAEGLAVGYGQPGVGKTFVFLDLALSICTGRDWLGATVRQGPVVYVAAEGQQGLAHRVEAWKLHHNIPLDEPVGFYTVPQALNLLDKASVESFLAEIAPTKPVAVIIDTLARCMPGGDENAPRDMSLAVSHADRIRTFLKATVLLIHHPGKEASSAERGHSSLRGAADTMFQLKTVKNVLQMTCTKQKDAAPFNPVSLRLTRPTGLASSLVVESLSAKRSLLPSEAQSLAALTSFGQEGASFREWMASSGIRKRTLYRCIEDLIPLGLVRRTTIGREHRYSLVTGR